MNLLDLPIFSDLNPGITEICLRLGCAMLIGLVIGTERQYTHRPAGLRTHILVALGACMVAITGELLFHEYKPLGGVPDPARLSAQVITGVGFIGAGTIIRDGSNVKGLTTAASLWSVACLGTASGFGYYVVSLIGMVFIFITLTIFEVLQRKFLETHQPQQFYQLQVRNLSSVLDLIHTQGESLRIEVSEIHTTQQDSRFHIGFSAMASGPAGSRHALRFLQSLAESPDVLVLNQSKEPLSSK